MYEFILAVQLVRGGSVERIPVHDCREGVVWIREAQRWAERSGMSAMEPMYMCYPAMFELERASEA